MCAQLHGRNSLPIAIAQSSTQAKDVGLIIYTEQYRGSI